MSGEALSSLVLNKMRGVLDVCAIKSPGFGDRRRGYLEDVAVLTGATFITEQLGLSLDQVGTATAQPALPAPHTPRPRALPAPRAALEPGAANQAARAS